MSRANGGGERTLADLLSALEDAAPGDRMDHREAVLAFGIACIGPLRDLATREPQLAASVSAWLEALADRDPSTKVDVVRALGALVRGSEGEYARSALGRLGAPPRVVGKPARERAPGRTAAQAEVHARIIQAAKEGRIVVYSDLETSRGHVGKYLFNISQEESDQGHPPLTSIVVSKTTGRPGDGFLPAMIEVGFAHEGEKLDDVWGRAVAAVHSFWQERKDG
jgi:hypothetical protein